MKHFPVWDLYSFERFSSVWMNPMFPLMFFRNKMWNDLNLIFGSKNSIFALSFLVVHFWKMLCFRNKACSYSLKHILFYTYTIAICNFSVLCLRISKVLGWGKYLFLSVETRLHVFRFYALQDFMSSIFYALQDFMSFVFYALQDFMSSIFMLYKTSCLLFLYFARLLVFCFYALQDFMSSVFMLYKTSCLLFLCFTM